MYTLHMKINLYDRNSTKEWKEQSYMGAKFLHAIKIKLVVKIGLL
jgi:hypothetical protein